MRASRPQAMAQSVTLPIPDDFHHHFRDGDALKTIVPLVAGRFRRAIAMPNLKPPVTTTDEAIAYRQRIMDAVPAGVDFQPLMTLYMTDRTTPEEIRRAVDSKVVHAVKLYPAGATTNSDSGVTKMEAVYPALEAMCETGLPLLVHSEVTDQDVDVFDREAVFVDTVLKPLVARFPTLRLVVEHVTTAESVDFVLQASDNVAATITPQHLLFNRNALFQGGLRPHMYCLPIIKHERHRQALLRAVGSGSPKFFLGTDSAPHARHAKENSCGCAGCFSAPIALELYAEAFASIDALQHLPAFTSIHGAAFYRLPPNQGSLTLVKRPSTVPDTYAFGSDVVVPLKAGTQLQWTVEMQ